MRSHKKTKPTKLERHMREIGAKGGKTTLEKYGNKHFKSLSKKRWANK